MIKQLESKPRMVEVAPNRFIQADLKLEVPQTVFCDVEPIPGQPGCFRLVPRSWERLVPVDQELCRHLGLKSIFTLKRLIRSGFVDGARVTPRVYTVNLDAFFRHMKRCADDPDFWENKKRVEAFTTAY